MVDTFQEATSQGRASQGRASRKLIGWGEEEVLEEDPVLHCSTCDATFFRSIDEMPARGNYANGQGWGCLECGAENVK